MPFKKEAIEAARAAGNIHQDHYIRGTRGRAKTASYDLVTEADLESERVIVDVLRRKFPDHNFMSEEQFSQKTASEYTWIIDPLDGTNNFACGIPFFCSSIALVKDGEPILGVVYDVMHDELFVAEKGQGAFLNDKKISVSNALSLPEAMLITGFYYDRGQGMVDTLGNMRKFFEQKVMGIRRFGAAALDLCYVACGRAGGFWEFQLNPWDFAAGMLLVEEAGGKVTGKQGNPVPLEKTYIVASNGHIHAAMLEVLGK
ncbi:MAG TPA: inositol monophosphatase family protein [Candidatus Bathyarchaeia archaeon]|nr:inositol monophosphatase family protein [Candidatus Bathyarchaeia archaeon]